MSVLQVAIVGANGVIGKVLQQGLTSCEIHPVGRSNNIDARKYEDLLNAFHGMDVVIHLALNPNKEIVRENFRSGLYDPDNSLITYNVYKAALEAKVKRVIVASSVHADDFYTFSGPGLLTVDHAPTPDSPYGANKLFMEFLGKYYATKGLEVVCVRFGGVNAADEQPEEYWEHNVWLSHDDCNAMMNACVHAESVPNNFSILYAISNNDHKIHDTANPFGWKPQ